MQKNHRAGSAGASDAAAGHVGSFCKGDPVQIWRRNVHSGDGTDGSAASGSRKLSTSNKNQPVIDVLEIVLVKAKIVLKKREKYQYTIVIRALESFMMQ